MVQFSIADLIDRLSIEHLKVKMKNSSTDCIANVESDLNDLLSISDFVAVSRFAVIFALVNLKCWKLKDDMDVNKKEEYGENLELAHDLNNGVKNSLKNIVLEKFKELTPSTRKSTFFDSAKWYSSLLNQLKI